MKNSPYGPVLSIYFIYSQYPNGFLTIELLYDSVSMSRKECPRQVWTKILKELTLLHPSNEFSKPCCPIGLQLKMSIHVLMYVISITGIVQWIQTELKGQGRIPTPKFIWKKLIHHGNSTFDL